MTEVTQTLRHYCRNPRCRSKLPSPASDPHKAFCTRGCHSSFYLKRCLVCENDKPAGYLRRTYQEVPNPRALKVPVLTTDLVISLLARKSPPRSIIVRRCR